MKPPKINKRNIIDNEKEYLIEIDKRLNKIIKLKSDIDKININKSKPKEV